MESTSRRGAAPGGGCGNESLHGGQSDAASIEDNAREIASAVDSSDAELFGYEEFMALSRVEVGNLFDRQVTNFDQEKMIEFFARNTGI